MSERFDVVIAGAGPAGAQCARDLAQRDYDVLVLETEPEDEFPRQSNKSTAGTFPSMMGAFGIPDDMVMQFTDTVVLESPNEHFVQQQPGAVLEFADFKRFLVREGREHGAEYRFGSRVSKPITEDGEVVGVEYSGDEEVYADIVIDATGPAAPLAKQLGVSDLERHNQAIGIEWEMEGVEVDHPDYADLHDAMMLRLDHDLAPGGYSWIFHTGEDTAKVGLCYIQNESYQERGKEGLSIDGYLDYWLDNDPRFENATKLEGKQHRGSAHIQEPGQLCTDSFMAIGDTVPTIDPLWGEGIHKGMKSARAAAITADRCLTGTVDTSKAAMETYADLWHQNVAPQAKRRLAMTRLLYLADNDRYDRLLRDVKDANMDTLADANGGNPLAIAKLLHFDDLSLLKRLATEHYL
ncbi:digeranylgeranylglycerophospholipid reductase [Salarchaeum japonicum]|uniref:Digeranylgeranylglycerophospholipid reductase n=1 Tax=Salarchaeum japonicum TaxID=555573 RepID=A0AAV3T4V5_9EURY|nr:digeranylgeranylglycerophospholipid reductase [Salarchaeum japonicum]